MRDARKRFAVLGLLCTETSPLRLPTADPRAEIGLGGIVLSAARQQVSLSEHLDGEPLGARFSTPTPGVGWTTQYKRVPRY